MAIDTATKRRSAAGVPIGIGVTPDATKGAAWRSGVGWGYYFVLPGADMVVEILLSNISADTDAECGVTFRLTDGSNFYAAYVDDGDNLLHLAKFVSASETTIATAAWTPADTAEIRVIVQQDRIRVWLNHILLIDEIDSTYLTPVRAGLFSRSTTAVRYSAFLAQMLSEVP